MDVNKDTITQNVSGAGKRARASKRKMAVTSQPDDLEGLKKVARRMNAIGEEVASTLKELA